MNNNQNAYISIICYVVKVRLFAAQIYVYEDNDNEP